MQLSPRDDSGNNTSQDRLISRDSSEQSDDSAEQRKLEPIIENEEEEEEDEYGEQKEAPHKSLMPSFS